MQLSPTLRNSTVRWYLCLSFFSRFAIGLTGATYVIFLESKGLNLFQANMVNWVFCAVMFLFEVPTGALADIFGRKLCYVLSCSLLLVGLFWYALAQNFFNCAAAEGIIAIGATLATGGFNAWLCDELKAQGKSELFRPTLSLRSILGNAISIAAALVGGYTAQINLALPFFIGGFAMIPALFLAMKFMHEGAYRRRKLSRVMPMLCLGVRYTITHPLIRLLFLIGFVQTIALQAANMQWQPLFIPFVHSEQGLGWLKAGISLSLLAGSWLSLLRTTKNHPLGLLVLCQFGIAMGVILAALSHSLIPMLVAFLGHEIFRGLVEPVTQTYLNDLIRSSRRRATVLSCGALGTDLGGMIGLPIWGAVAVHESVRTAWIISGIFLIVVILGLVHRIPKQNLV